jgi:hypothetical protein
MADAFKCHLCGMDLLERSAVVGHDIAVDEHDAKFHPFTETNNDAPLCAGDED